MNAECPLNVWFVTLFLGAKPHWFIPQETQRVFKRDGIFGDYHSGVPRNRHFCCKERMYGPNETKKWRLSPNLKPWKNWRIRDWSSCSSCCTFRTACPSSTIITISTWLELQPPNQLLVCSPFSIGKNRKKTWPSLRLIGSENTTYLQCWNLEARKAKLSAEIWGNHFIFPSFESPGGCCPSILWRYQSPLQTNRWTKPKDSGFGGKTFELRRVKVLRCSFRWRSSKETFLIVRKIQQNHIYKNTSKYQVLVSEESTTIDGKTILHWFECRYEHPNMPFLNRVS